MSNGKKLTIFMINGSSHGPRTAEIGNWSGKAIYSPRVNIEEILEREEMAKPAVYILKSDSDDDNFSERVYIGQSETLGQRLKSHHLYNKNDDWKEFIAFISKDDLLTSSQTRYLESQLIALAKEAKTAQISNSQSPKLPLLSEPDRADMEYFLEQMNLIISLMGFRFLNRTVVKRIEEEKRGEERREKSTFMIINKTLQAQMIESSEGFVVLSGSQGNKNVSASISESWRKQRESLIRKGALEDKETHYEFVEDVIFDSISAAASVVLGRQAAGPLMWKEKTTNLTYKEFKETDNRKKDE